MDTVGVIGSNGMLGRYVSLFLERNNYNVVRFTRLMLDLEDYNQITSINNLCNILSKYNINALVNCAGLIPHRKSDDTKKYIKVNSIAPLCLANACFILNIKFVHITTDCVYSGSKGQYDESDEHTAKDIYGISKSLGEPVDVTVIRVSIIGEELDNKQSLLEWVRSNRNGCIKGFANQFWSGVTCLQLAKIIKEIIERKCYWKGVRHIISETVSKYELLCIINKVYDLNINIQKIDCDFYNNKSLSSNLPALEWLTVPSLYNQILEQSTFNISHGIAS